jgi:hypothetical protein
MVDYMYIVDVLSCQETCKASLTFGVARISAHAATVQD